jgi:hypothetical protein
LRDARCAYTQPITALQTVAQLKGDAAERLMELAATQCELAENMEIRVASGNPFRLSILLSRRGARRVG